MKGWRIPSLFVFILIGIVMLESDYMNSWMALFWSGGVIGGTIWAGFGDSGDLYKDDVVERKTEGERE